MPAFVINDPTEGPVVIASLSEWQVAGRFLHIPAPSDAATDRPLRMIGYRCRGEAERLAQYVNDQLVARAAFLDQALERLSAGGAA